MSRENKFRGQRVDNDEWVYGYLIGNDIIVGKIIDFEDDYFTTEFWYKVDQSTVGQLTGLHDKSGVEIYEGDICIGKRGGEPYEFTVKWDEVDARFLGYTNSGYICYVGQEPCVEVIGNIHEKESEK